VFTELMALYVLHITRNLAVSTVYVASGSEIYDVFVGRECSFGGKDKKCLHFNRINKINFEIRLRFLGTNVVLIQRIVYWRSVVLTVCDL
jgi:hypothetical protein